MFLLLDKVRAKGVPKCADVNPRFGDLGVCAQALRSYFCRGEAAALTRPDLMGRIYPAFAGLDVRGPERTHDPYKRWVQKLAVAEFADELVVLAVALELRIRTCCIPYTPDSEPSPWAPSTYGPATLPGGPEGTIYVGNNDVHYVFLSQRG